MSNNSSPPQSPILASFRLPSPSPTSPASPASPSPPPSNSRLVRYQRNSSISKTLFSPLPRSSSQTCLIDLTTSSVPLRSQPPKTVNRTKRSTAKSSVTGSKQTVNTSSYRLQAKNVFLTFPQCSLSKSEAMANIHKLVSLQQLSLRGAIVAQEKHADGSPHLHCALFFEDRLRTRDCHFFDSVAMKHGSYEAIYSIPKTLNYVKKDDPCPLIFGTLPTDSAALRPSKSTAVAAAILTGSTIAKVASMDPGYFMLNKRKIEEFHSFCADLSVTKSRERLILPVFYTGTHQATSRVIDWLNSNLFTTRPLKSPQLYLHGPPNSLKTSLIISLQKYLSVYFMPINEDFYDFYSDDAVDLIVLDEFQGSKPINVLNQWLDGQELTVRVKGSQRKKRKNQPFIILSNFSVDQCYSATLNGFPVKLDSLKARLLEVSLDAPLDLANVHFNASSGKESVDSTDDDILSPVL